MERQIIPRIHRRQLDLFVGDGYFFRLMKANSFALFVCAVLVLLGDGRSLVKAAESPTKFGAKWNTLMGEWQGRDNVGANSGACGFHFDLAGQIIVRTNHVVLPPTGGSAGTVHDDLLVIYRGPTEDRGRAIYFDNEGHVIEYDADWSPDGTTLTFLSKPGAGPQFRLLYKRDKSGSFDVSFAIAPPGQSVFKPYTSGKIKKL